MPRSHNKHKHTELAKMSESWSDEQREINIKILNELSFMRYENEEKRSEFYQMKKMFEELMRSLKGKEPINMEESSQNAKIASTQA